MINKNILWNVKYFQTLQFNIFVKCICIILKNIYIIPFLIAEYIILENEESFTEMINGNIDTTLNHTELQRFALQIAKGMEHLEKIPIVHRYIVIEIIILHFAEKNVYRDLAARNILISMDKTLKISDFGLSRICPYVNQKTKKMPLRWVAIEAIEDHFYDGKSDVWSFAVVLWEIGTLGNPF